MELDNGRVDSETPEHRNLSAALNVPGLIRPTRWSKQTVEKVLVTFNFIVMRRNMEIKKM